MKQNNGMKFKRILAMLLTVAAMLGTVVPAWANEAPVPQFSKWALGVLNEGERYGIFPITWYYEGFQEQISEEKMQVLLQGVRSKLAALKLNINPSFKPQAASKGKTRGDIITSLYNEVAKYEMPKDDQLGKVPAAIYFEKRGIVKGTNKGLELDKPCTVEQAVIFAIKLLENTYETADAGSKGLMWKVTKGENTLYLLGSIHVGDVTMYPIKKEIKEAFKTSDVLFVEANVFNQQADMSEFIKIAMYDDGTTLKDHVSESTYNKAVKVFEKFSLPKDQFSQFKPWSVANNLTTISSSNSNTAQSAAEAATLGVDMYFLTSAAVSNKPIAELEGLKYQANLFNNLSAKVQEEYLNSVMDSILSPGPSGELKLKESITLMQKHWIEGDIESYKKTYAMTDEEAESEFMKMLLGQRDKDMTEKLIKLLDKEGKATYFVVVGAGHLVAKGTIIDLLKDKGYSVELLK